ncbi:MAG TPA: NAD(P)-binding domain-containing protein [Candidatus Acidoferrales bacterium]|nr:NAD(P)-binding domain-containing protein [Candidatus Acidoferrales bacterium]
MAIIGIIGSDDRAVAIGRMLRKSGYTISFSNLADDRTAQAAAEVLGDGAFATTPYQQAAVCDALVLAVRWQDVDRALNAIGSYKDGIVVDATRPPDLGRMSGAELVAHKLDNYHVVKGFVEPLESADFIKIASDDPEARAEIGEIIVHCGRSPLDVGPLANARQIEREVAQRLTH